MSIRAALALMLCSPLLSVPSGAEPMFPPVKGTVPDPPKPDPPEDTPEAKAEEPAPSAAQSFLLCLRDADATPEQRRAAWDALRQEDKPLPRAVAAAVERSRQRAWRDLTALLATAAVRRHTSTLAKRVAPHRAKALAAIRGKGFSRERLDAAMKPILDPFEAAMEALREAEGYEEGMARLNEFETYASEAALRFGWSQELGDVLVALRLVAGALGGSATFQVLGHNRKVGDLIEPAESACVARLNAHRLLLGIRPSEMDLRLVIAAKKHCEEMAAKGYFSHASSTPGRESPWKRAAREGTGAGGECIAAGTKSGVGAFRMWYYSQGHHRIMTGGSAIGVGTAGGKFTLMTGGSKLRGAAAERYASYVRDRYRAGGDADRLAKLARQCLSAGLRAQAMDEAQRALALAPDHEMAERTADALRAP